MRDGQVAAVRRQTGQGLAVPHAGDDVLASVHDQQRGCDAGCQGGEVNVSYELVGGVGPVIFFAVGDGTSFPSAAHLASYVSLAPTTKSSGTSIHGEHAPRGGNRQLKRAMFLSAFAALHDPASRTYYDKCRARGKTHTQALLRLARHRISVLFAILRDGTFYEHRTPRLT